MPKGVSKSTVDETLIHAPTMKGTNRTWTQRPNVRGVPDGVEDQGARESRMYREVGDITITRHWHEGKIRHPRLGERLGWLYRYANNEVTRHGDVWAGDVGITKLRRFTIRALGEVQLGLGTYVVCTSEGSTWVFLAKDARVWRHVAVNLPSPAPNLQQLHPHERIVYAQQVCDLFEDTVVPAPERDLTREAVRRYHTLVAGFVAERIVEAGVRGVAKDAKGWAWGISRSWSSIDLLRPRCPTVLHAILVSLVLALDARKAGALIEWAGLIEYRIPLISGAAAEALYQQACHLLASLAPEWWQSSYLTDWSTIGTIESKFAAQFARLLFEAWGRTGGSATGQAPTVGPPVPEAESEPEDPTDPLEEDVAGDEGPGPEPEAPTGGARGRAFVKRGHRQQLHDEEQYAVDVQWADAGPIWWPGEERIVRSW